MSKEMELKLRCTESLDWVLINYELDSLSCARVSEPAVASLHNTYFDTPELDLHRQKVALRIRKKGVSKLEDEDGIEAEPVRYIQTLKTAGQSVNGISQRGEWEWDLPALLQSTSPSPSPTHESKEPMIDTALLQTVEVWADQVDVDASRLVPVFTTNFQRTSQLIAWAGYRFELVLDQGAVTVPGSTRITPINEIEIEYCQALGSGFGSGPGAADQALAPEHALRELGELLCAKLPLESEDASKAQRGYALFMSVAVQGSMS